jgi:hypothetical protein
MIRRPFIRYKKLAAQYYGPVELALKNLLVSMKKNDATNHFCIVGCAYSGTENDAIPWGGGSDGGSGKTRDGVLGAPQGEGRRRRYARAVVDNDRPLIRSYLIPGEPTRCCKAGKSLS